MFKLKTNEIRNGRLAMLAMLGYGAQAVLTGAGPFENLKVGRSGGRPGQARLATDGACRPTGQCSRKGLFACWWGQQS